MWDDLLKQSAPAFTVRHIPEPALLFRGGQRCVDPKTGIELYGPAAHDHGHRGSIRVGVIGTGDTLTALRKWTERAKTRIDAGLNAKGRPYDSFLYPSFPGFTLDSPFSCELSFSERLTVTLTSRQIDQCLTANSFAGRVRGAVELVANQLSVLADKDPPPDVVICAMPKAVEDACGRHANDGRKRPAVSKGSRKLERRVALDLQRGQRFLFNPYADEDGDGLTAPSLSFRSFHNAISTSRETFRR